MKKDLLTLFAVLIAAPLFFAGCSDDDDDDNGDDSIKMSVYFPTSTGSWWKYENKEYDEFDEVTYIDYDSTVCVGSTILEDKTAYIFINYNFDEDMNFMDADTGYFAVEESKLYMYEEEDLEFGEFGSEIETPNWILAADFGQSSWSIIEEDINMSQMGMTIDLSFSVKGFRAGGKTVTAAGETMVAQSFREEIKIEGTYLIPPMPEISIDMTAIATIYLAQNIGIVKTSGDMLNDDYEIDGRMETLLLDYKIK